VCPIVAPVPPSELLAILQLYGYKIVVESYYNWVLVHEDGDTPLVLGKLGDAVPVEVMENMFSHSGMTDAVFFALKAALRGNNPQVH
jgi:hypothetical protein